MDCNYSIDGKLLEFFTFERFWCVCFHDYVHNVLKVQGLASELFRSTICHSSMFMVSLYVSVCKCESEGVWVHASVKAYECEMMYLCKWVRVTVSVQVWVHASLSVGEWKHEWLRESVHSSVNVYECKWSVSVCEIVPAYSNLCEYLLMCMFVFMYMQVCECVCVRKWECLQVQANVTSCKGEYVQVCTNVNDYECNCAWVWGHLSGVCYMYVYIYIFHCKKCEECLQVWAFVSVSTFKCECM